MIGHRRIVLRSDEESNIMALGTAVKREAEIDIVSEQTAVGDHQANGSIENAVRQIAGQFRTIKDGLETRINHKIKGEMSIVPWMISHLQMEGQRIQQGNHRVWRMHHVSQARFGRQGQVQQPLGRRSVPGSAGRISGDNSGHTRRNHQG